MRFDETMIQNAQRHAFKTLSDPKSIKAIRDAAAKENNSALQFKTNPKNITCPAVLVQEAFFVNTQNIYEFQFGSSASNKPTDELNNIVLGENDVFAQYGYQILFGTQAPAASRLVSKRIYNSRGILFGDYALYTGKIKMEIETNTPVNNISMQEFLDARNANIYDMDSASGLMLSNPQRILTGRLSNIKITITLPTLTTNVLSTNAVISVRLHGALGQASF